MAIKFVIRRYPDAPGSPSLAETAFHGPMATIGRDEAATIRLDDHSIALEQAVVINEEGKLILINQAEGTFLNDERLSREAIRPLKEGDRLRIGAYLIEVLFHEPAVSEAAHESEPNPSTTENLSSPATSPASTPLQSAPTEEAPPRRSFAAILDSLRTEEDSFYFMIEGGTQSRRRVPIDRMEMIIGWDETGQNISCELAVVVAPRALVRKDWSGVIVQAHKDGDISVNDEPIDGARRLHNGDRLTLFPTAVTPEQNRQYLIFHVPASLVALDSMLPQKLPPPVAVRAETETNTKEPDPSSTLPSVPERSAPLFDQQTRYFGYFTLIELMLMACGTLIAAVIIFLFLEYL